MLNEQPKFVRICYMDKDTYTDGWVNLEQTFWHDLFATTQQAIGFLVNEDETYLYLAQEIDRHDGTGKCRGLICVPKACIYSRYELEHKNEKS